MCKTVELGRAVLSTSAANLELWLKTLIAISPQQQRANLEQYNAATLLNVLFSDEVWIARGNGLYIDLDVTFKGRPVADEQLRRLTQAILDAPVSQLRILGAAQLTKYMEVWEQLSLQPSVPNQSLYELGKVRIAINHAMECAVPIQKSQHRILLNTSYAALRPPQGLCVMSLDSILISADIFEPAKRRKVAMNRRPKTPNQNSSMPPATSGTTVGKAGTSTSDELLFEGDSMVPSETSSPSLKRQRSPSSSAELRSLTRLAHPTENSPDQLPAGQGPEASGIESERGLDVDLTELLKLVEGALRLSVLGAVNNKSSSTTLKTKANTFKFGLVDITPNLWKPGYLPVRTLGTDLAFMNLPVE